MSTGIECVRECSECVVFLPNIEHAKERNTFIACLYERVCLLHISVALFPSGVVSSAQPSMLPYTCISYNVTNDRTFGPSAGRVQNKQQVAGADR